MILGRDDHSHHVPVIGALRRSGYRHEEIVHPVHRRRGIHAAHKKILPLFKVEEDLRYMSDRKLRSPSLPEASDADRELHEQRVRETAQHLAPHLALRLGELFLLRMQQGILEDASSDGEKTPHVKAGAVGFRRPGGLEIRLLICPVRCDQVFVAIDQLPGGVLDEPRRYQRRRPRRQPSLFSGEYHDLGIIALKESSALYEFFYIAVSDAEDTRLRSVRTLLRGVRQLLVRAEIPDVIAAFERFSGFPLFLPGIVRDRKLFQPLRVLSVLSVHEHSADLVLYRHF